MKILIIGMREKEKDRIIKIKGLEIDFVFSNNITNKKLKNISKYNHVIGICKFSVHLVEYMCNNHPGFIRLRPTQGISSVNNILENLHV